MEKRMFIAKTPCQILFEEIAYGDERLAHTVALAACAGIKKRDLGVAIPLVESMLLFITERYPSRDYNLKTLSDLAGAAYCFDLLIKEVDEGLTYDIDSGEFVKDECWYNPDSHAAKVFHRAEKRCKNVYHDLRGPGKTVQTAIDNIRREVGEDVFAAVVLADWEMRTGRTCGEAAHLWREREHAKRREAMKARHRAANEALKQKINS